VLADRGGAGEEEIAIALALPALETRRALDALVGAGVVRLSEGRYLPLTAA
jgi:DNA-binding IclR family transcriptional regulator